MDIEDRVAGLENEYTRVVDELADPSVYTDQKRFKELSRRFKELEAIVTTNRELKAVAADLQAAAELTELASPDEVDSIEAEIGSLRRRQAQLEEQMEVVMLHSLVVPYRFKEAYLCEAMGSYMFLTETGEIYGLIVNNADQIEVWTDSQEAFNADAGLLGELENRTKMMWYHNRNGALEPPGREWVNHAYEPKTLQGTKENYYYIFGQDLFDVDRTRVLSFEKYKETGRFEIQH